MSYNGTPRILSALLFFVLAGLPAVAQTGRILGTITDETGGVLPGVTVIATATATNISREFVTGDLGTYEFPGLLVGEYIVAAELTGFKRAQVTVTVEVEQILRQDLRLSIGEISEIVEVNSETPLLSTSKAEVGQVITSRQIVELPLNGRNYTQLLLLVPGVTPRGGGLSEFGDSGNFAINGARPGSENYMIEGMTTNAGNTRQAQISPSIESIAEFKLQTSTYAAEFGRGSAAVNVTTKSGANEFRGVVYAFNRNDKFAANGFFQNQAPDPDTIGVKLNRNQYGATFGGPIIKNRTFFFFNYEGERRDEGRATTWRVPTDLERAGDFSRSAGVRFVLDPATRQPFPGLKVPSSRFHSVYDYFQGFWPGPNTADGFLITASDTVFDTDQWGVRVDHTFSQADTVFFRYFRGRRDNRNPGIGTEPFFLESNVENIDNYQLVARWTHSFAPTWLLDVQYGRYNFDTVGVVGPQCLKEQGCTNHAVAGGIPNLEFSSENFPGAPQFSFGGGGWAQLRGARDPIILTYPTDSWLIDTTWIRGRHTIKGGFDSFRKDLNATLGILSRGIFPMTGALTSGGRTPWSDFMLGQVLPPLRAAPGTRVGVDTRSFHWYIQDDWKVTSRLTINIGLRYELNYFPGAIAGSAGVDPQTGRLIFADSDGDGTPIHEARFSSAFEHLFPIVKDSLDASSALGLHHSLTNVDRNNWAPRIGAAYRVGKNTVVRAGYGIYYLTIANANIAEQTFFMPPFTIIETGRAGSIDNVWDSPFPNRILPGTWNAVSFDPNQKWPYENQFSLNIQHSLASNLVLETGYVGKTGINLISRSRITLPSDRPRFVPGSVTLHDSGSNSNYHGWQTSLEKRYSNGLAFSANYTWSKAMDISSEDIDSGGRDGLGFNQYSVADFDVPHRFVVSSVWDMPFGYGRKYLSGRSGFVDAVLGGWQLSIIAQFQSGNPYHVRWQTGSNSDRVPFSVIPDRITDGSLPDPTPERWFDGSAFVAHRRPPDPNRPGRFLLEEGNAGRNILRAHGMHNWDIGLMKNWFWGERYRVQFRAEMFNAFNRVQFARPGNCGVGCWGRSRAGNNPFVGGVNDGRVFQTLSLPRQIQFGLKLFF